MKIGKRSFKGNVPVRLLETRFEARNCISEPCPQEPYKDIFLFVSFSSPNGFYKVSMLGSWGQVH
jgi:hypothetical protein